MSEAASLIVRGLSEIKHGMALLSRKGGMPMEIMLSDHDDGMRLMDALSYEFLPNGKTPEPMLEKGENGYREYF